MACNTRTFENDQRMNFNFVVAYFGALILLTIVVVPFGFIS